MLRSMSIALLAATTAAADPAVVEDVTAKQSGTSWTFSVTLSHADTGWDDYADGWRVLDMQGNEIATRVLAHPHVNEQPFTRSLSGIVLPEGTHQVHIIASESKGGWSSTAYLYELN